MKKTFLFVYFLITSLTSVNSQAQSVLNDTDIDKYISKISIPIINEINLIGTPYSHEEFQKGTAVKNGLTFAYNIGLRYNAHKDIFEIKKTFVLTDNQARLLKKTDDISLKINNNHFIFIPPNENNKVHGYFVLLHKGDNISLLKKIKKVYIPGQKAYSSMAKPVAPTYKEKITLFISNKEGVITELPNPKNKKIDAFNKDKKEIKFFIKENKLNINKEKDLIKLTEYINTL